MEFQSLVSVETRDVFTEGESMSFWKRYKVIASESLSPNSEITSLAVHPSRNSTVVAVTYSTCAAFVDLAPAIRERKELSVVSTFSKSKAPTTCCAFRPDGNLFAVGDQSGRVLVYNLKGNREVLRRFRTADEGVSSVMFTSDATAIVAGCTDGSVRLLDLTSGECAWTEVGHADVVRAVECVGSYAYSAGADGKVVVWNIERTGTSEDTSRKVAELDHGAPIDSIRVAPSKTVLLSVSSAGNRVVSWDLLRRKQNATFALRHSRPVTGMVFTEDGSEIVTSALDGTVKVCSSVDGELIRSLSCKSSEKSVGVSCVGLACHGRAVVYGTTGGDLQLRFRAFGPTEDAAVELARPKVLPAHTLSRTQRYFCRGQKSDEADDNEMALQGNVVVGSRRKGGKREKTIDYLLRKFEYRKVIDVAISTEHKQDMGLILCVFDELIQRGALTAALRNRSPAEIRALLQNCILLAINKGLVGVLDIEGPAEVLSDVVDYLLLELARHPPAASADIESIRELLVKVSSAVKQELAHHKHLVPLAGLIDSVLNC